MGKETNSIPLQTAKSWAKKWRKEEGNYNKHHFLKAFFIPKEDILETLMEQVDGLRAYVGVDENNEEKLMIVGTKYNPETDTYEDMLPDREEGLRGEIYDFTRPCPHMCDRDSSLNSLND
jgi:hypothetical protein